MILAWLAMAAAAPRPADPAWARVDAALRDAGEAWGGADVAVHPEAGVSGPALAARLVASGLSVRAVSPDAVQVAGPVDLRGLAGVPGVARVRPPRRAVPKGVRSEGVDALGVEPWHEAGLDGAGVVVGIVDVGFAGWEDALGAELPGRVRTDFRFGAPGRSAHGTAVAEVVHDIAPEAELVLVTVETDVELAGALESLVAAGADVINASIGFDNVWHADATSPMTRLADAVAAHGVLYVAAAGNEALRTRVGVLGTPDDDGVVPIGDRSGAWVWAPDGWARATLRWSEPFGGATTDLDLVLVNADGSPCGRGTESQDGRGDPFESVNAVACTPWVRARVEAADGQVPAGLTATLHAPGGMAAEAATGARSLTLPADLRNGVTVGAWDVPSDAPFPYSSRGPTDDGRAKPELLAPSAVSTDAFGARAFQGTSAAAPHVAGLAALWISATGRFRDPDAVRDWLADRARLPPADARVAGTGIARAGEVPAGTGGCGSVPAQGRWGGILVGCALAVMRRRRPACVG
ncbi:MAG: hypothetical protein RLZZ299_444 [Pseudomonadota bacterium]